MYIYIMFSSLKFRIVRNLLVFLLVFFFSMSIDVINYNYTLYSSNALAQDSPFAVTVIDVETIELGPTRSGSGGGGCSPEIIEDVVTAFKEIRALLEIANVDVDVLDAVLAIFFAPEGTEITEVLVDGSPLDCTPSRGEMVTCEIGNINPDEAKDVTAILESEVESPDDLILILEAENQEPTEVAIPIDTDPILVINFSESSQGSSTLGNNNYLANLALLSMLPAIVLVRRFSSRRQKQK